MAESSGGGVPEGYATVTPWVISGDTNRLLEFIGDAFGGVELARLCNAEGAVEHAEAQIGDSVVMAFDARPGWPGTPACLRLYVDDAARTYERALRAGATPVTEVTELFFGDRVGRVRDPVGNIWWIQERVEQVDSEELGRRASLPEYARGMAYVQESLDAVMRGDGAQLPRAAGS